MLCYVTLIDLQHNTDRMSDRERERERDKPEDEPPQKSIEDKRIALQNNSEQRTNCTCSQFFWLTVRQLCVCVWMCMQIAC